MSEVQNPDPNAAQAPVVETQTETATVTAPAETAPADPTAAAAPAYIAESDDAGKNVTPFVKPDLQPCPNCASGLLYVIGYDDKAMHEVGQPIYFPNMLSGGSVQVACFVCGHGETHALNPQPAPVNPNPGA